MHRLIPTQGNAAAGLKMGNLALSGTVLVVAGINLAECKSEKTPNQLLCKAAGDGNIATMKQALYSGADVNCLTSDGEVCKTHLRAQVGLSPTCFQTAMHKACGRGHIEAMRVLVDHGFCEFNVQDDHGWVIACLHYVLHLLWKLPPFCAVVTITITALRRLSTKPPEEATWRPSESFVNWASPM